MITRSLLALSGLAVSATAFALPSYSFIDVGTLWVNGATADAVNSSGVVVGGSQITGGYLTAFTSSNGVINPIPTAGITGISRAFGINDHGQIVGTAEMGGIRKAFLLSNGVLHNLGAFNNSIYESAAFDINNSGQIVGESFGFNNKRAFLYEDGVMHHLGTMGGDVSVATEINDQGTVVGYSSLANGEYRAFRYSGSTMTNLGTLSGDYSSAHAISESGIIAGVFGATTGNLRPFIYQNNSMQAIPGFGKRFELGLGVNDSGYVVGYSRTTEFDSVAFLYANGVTTDLNTLVSDLPTGWRLASAVAISNSGYITGTARINGQTRGFLLRPVPEPATIFALGAGALALMRRRRGK